MWDSDKIYEDCLNLIQFSDEEEQLEKDYGSDEWNTQGEKVCKIDQQNTLVESQPEHYQAHYDNVFNFGLDWNPIPSLGSIGSPPTTPTTISSGCSYSSKAWSSLTSESVDPRNGFNNIITSSKSTSTAYTYEDLMKSKSASNERENQFNLQSKTVFKRLHVSNIPFRYRREHLFNIFSLFGIVLDTEIIFNERGSKGFGFVSFEDPLAAQKAKNALDNLVIDGRKIEVNYATPRPRRGGNQNKLNKNQNINSTKPSTSTLPHLNYINPFHMNVNKMDRMIRSRINV